MNSGRILLLGDQGDGSGPTPGRRQPRNVVGKLKTTGMQGLWIDTDHFGHAPFWDPDITAPEFTDADFGRAVAVKRAAADTHWLIDLTGAYYESGLVAPYNGRDFTQELPDGLPTFRKYIDRILNEGFLPVPMLGGDGLSLMPNGQRAPDGYDGPFIYNDPVGWTYGHQWLMANFRQIYTALSDLAQVWCPGYDGCVPGWAGDENRWQRVDEWLLFARSVVKDDDVLAIETSAGYYAWSGEHNDYATPAGQCLDATWSEYPYPIGPPASPPEDFCNQPNETRSPWDQVYQISKRLLGPDWKRPADMPACDDPGMAPDLGSTPRGELFKCALEFDTYGHVRGLDPAIVQTHRQVFRSIGWGDRVG